MMDDTVLYVIREYGLIFTSTRARIADAEMLTNREFVLTGSVTFNSFLKYIDERISIINGDDIGWEQYLGEALYGYSFIDFDHKDIRLSNGRRAVLISMPFPPHPFDEADCIRHIESIISEFVNVR